MAEFVPCCLKRKDRGDPLTYFSDISLSSPAIKIRRIDYFVPKGEDGLKQHSLEETIAAESVAQGASAIMCSENNIGEESALVLYKSTTTPLCKSLRSSDFPIVLNSNLIPQLKDILKLIEDGKCGRSRNNESTRDSLAVIPWVESQLPPAVDWRNQRHHAHLS
ncbi:hypothetical protein Nepgr_013655 [Nepenthes gracilis]|uniref:Uncharacterized protein n=1 Tax=Nepenthes gracilis TaxID=150966 RepID=A0AAD3SJ93_NEPGR|nr:hypothetical protein Nepgr_013655 [Nepenthes gracilis]